MTAAEQPTTSEVLRPLEHIRVVEFGQFIAGPGTSALLGEMGADVVKVEPPSGDSARTSGPFGTSMFAAYNRRKRSVVADLDSDDGVELARRLCLTADVVVDNSRPGALGRRGLAHADLAPARPDLVYGSVSGFPAGGPDASRPAFDVVAQAESGMMAIVGERDGAPLKVAFTLVDSATTHALTHGIVAALLHRERTGAGSHVEVSLLDVAYSLQSQVWAQYFASDAEPVRFGNGHPQVAPAGDLVAVADGHIVVSAYTEGHWRRLCAALHRDDLVDDPRFATPDVRVANRPALLAELHHVLASDDRRSAVSRLTDAGVVAGAVLTYREAATASNAGHSTMLQPYQDDSLLPRLGNPVTSSAWQPPGPGRPPSLGEHTEQIRNELGLA